MKTIEISWRRYILPNIHPEGWKFVGIFAAITALLAMIWEPLGWLGIIATIWCFYFFRDPERVTPTFQDVVVSPADGIVQMITKVKAPEELGLGDKKFTRVSVFMSVFNVHVNRSPGQCAVLHLHALMPVRPCAAQHAAEVASRLAYVEVMAVFDEAVFHPAIDGSGEAVVVGIEGDGIVIGAEARIADGEIASVAQVDAVLVACDIESFQQDVLEAADVDAIAEQRQILAFVIAHHQIANA